MRSIHVWLFGLLPLLCAAPSVAQPTAFVGGRVIDGTGRVVEAGTVIIDAGRITAAGAASVIRVPPGATRVDVSGKTLLPGLVNAHGHVAPTQGLRSDPSFYTRENLVRQLRTYAQYGVTTVYSLGGDQADAFLLREEQGQGPIDRARIFVAGPVMFADTAEAATALADSVADLKPDLLKIRVDDNLGTTRKMPEVAWRASIARAHQRGLRLAVHVYYLEDARATVMAGADFVAHSVRDRDVDAAFIAELKKRDVCYCPTLTREVSTFIYESTPPWVDDPFFLKGVAPEIPSQLREPERQAQFRQSPEWKQGQQYKAGLEVAKRNLNTVVSQSVRVALGTDTGPPGRFQGFFEHLELEMMVDAGMTPMQALVAATGDAARCHQKSGQVGTLAPGAAADLLVLGANPLDNIRNTRTIEQVWIAGKRAF